MSKSPYGYAWADWLAREDPEYAAARQQASALAIGHGKELTIKHREMVIIGVKGLMQLETEGAFKRG